MTARLHTFIAEDTPSNVEVPKTVISLFQWMVGRFGAGIVVAAVLLYLFIRIDNRAAAREEKLLSAYVTSAQVQLQTSENLEDCTEAMETNTEALKQLTRTAERAHTIRN